MYVDTILLTFSCEKNGKDTIIAYILFASYCVSNCIYSNVIRCITWPLTLSGVQCYHHCPLTLSGVQCCPRCQSTLAVCSAALAASNIATHPERCAVLPSLPIILNGCSVALVATHPDRCAVLPSLPLSLTGVECCSRCHSP